MKSGALEHAHNLHQCAMTALSSPFADVRIGGLKLIGSLLCDTEISKEMFSDVLEFRNTANKLSSIVNLDTNKEVRSLAEKILVNSFSD